MIGMPAHSSVPVRKLWISVFFGYLSLGSTIQEIPTFVEQKFDGGPILCGVAVSVAFLATALCRPFAGLLADQNRARYVVTTGGILGVIGGFGHLLAFNPAVLLVARLFMGAGEAALFSGAIPWVLSNATASNRGKIAGWFGLSMWGGLALGPALASLIDHYAGYQGVWWMVSLLAASSALLVFTTGNRGNNPQKIEWPETLGSLVPRASLFPGLIFGLSAYGYGTISAMIVLHLRSSGIGGDTIALPAFALAFLCTRYMGSPLVDRFGGVKVALVSLVIEAIGLFASGVADHEQLAVAGTALAGAGVSLMYPATVAVTLKRTGPIRPGTAVGAVTSFWDLGIMIAGPVGGIVAAFFSYKLAFLIAVAMSLIACTLCRRLAQDAPKVVGE